MKTYIRLVLGSLVVAGLLTSGTSLATATNHVSDYYDNSVSFCDLGSKKLQRGSRGKSVERLQEILSRYQDQDLVVDGVFGRGTRAQVMNFQRDNGLTADGIVGYNTRVAMVDWCSLNNDGNMYQNGNNGNNGSNTRNVSFDNSITLYKGNTVTFNDGLKIKISEITDSRCKATYTCVWAGEIATNLETSGGNMSNNYGTQIVRLGTANSTTVDQSGYTFTLLSATSSSVTIKVSNTQNNISSSNKTIYTGEPFTIRKGDKATMSGGSQNLVVTVEGIYSNSCVANASYNTACTADYAPVVRLSYVSGYDNVTSLTPLIGIGQTEEMGIYNVTVQDISYSGSNQIVTLLVKVKNTNNNGNTYYNNTGSITVETGYATAANANSAILNGYVSGLSNNYNNGQTMYFEYGTSSSNLNQTSASSILVNGDFTKVIGGLTSGITYYYRLVVNMGSGNYQYGAVKNVTIQANNY